jgi:hypothetical protein
VTARFRFSSLEMYGIAKIVRGPQHRNAMRCFRPRLQVFAIFLLVSIFGCAPEKQQPPAIFLPMTYLHASSALAADDFGKAKVFLRALAAESRGDLKARAEDAAGTGDIEAMRESFKALTEEVAVHMGYPDDYAVAFCPRYKNGSKWIQKREAPIANPYLGKSVPACGSFVD